MKIWIISIVFLTAPLFLAAQKSNPEKLSLRIQNLTNIDASLQAKAAKSGLSWECCIEEKCKCTDLKDPWEEDGLLSRTQQMNAITNNPNAAAVQKDMVAFEQEIVSGKGKEKVTKADVEKAFAKHPGYSLNAIKIRMDIYINKLESE